jgi:hypothetical protein
VSIPIDEFGSNFRIGPLTGPDARVRVQVMHLPPNGLIGRHPTGVQQLFALITGVADVSGTDGNVRRIGPGFAALWMPGEEHETRSEPGCTALCIEGRFDMWATAVTKDIAVVDYDERWPAWFAQLHDRIWPAVASHAARIDHVGSTSVPGIAAKAVIDMDIVVEDESSVRPVILALRDVGYSWRGDLGVDGRQAFAYLGADELPEHHLYLVVEGNKAHLDHVTCCGATTTPVIGMARASGPTSRSPPATWTSTSPPRRAWSPSSSPAPAPRPDCRPPSTGRPDGWCHARGPRVRGSRIRGGNVTKLTRVLLALAVLLSAGLAACGGGDDSTSAKTNATISSNQAKAAARAAGVDESCVQGVQAYSALAGIAGSAFTGGAADVDKNIKAFKAYADAGPSAIRADLHVLAGAYSVYAKAIADSGYNPSSGKPPTQEQAAALSAAGDKIGSTDVKTAGDKVSAYFDEHCKKK